VRAVVERLSMSLSNVLQGIRCVLFACSLSSYLFGVNAHADVPDVVDAEGADEELNRADRV